MCSQRIRLWIMQREEQKGICALHSFFKNLPTSKHLLHKQEQKSSKLLRNPSYLNCWICCVGGGLCWGRGEICCSPSSCMGRPHICGVEDAQPCSLLPSDAGHEFHFLSGWFQEWWGGLNSDPNRYLNSVSIGEQIEKESDDLFIYLLKIVHFQTLLKIWA